MNKPTIKGGGSAGSRGGRAMFVSFSGIDGAGKSTQIEHLSDCLRERGLHVEYIRFWDDIARLKRVRETTGHKVFKGDKGVGSPEAPINRRDKNVQSWPMTWVRLFLYFVDAVSTRQVVNRAIRSGSDFVIFDRYTYDEFANLNLNNRLIRLYIRLISCFVPTPDISYVLDADPVSARQRKPEYPLEFLRTNRQAYLTLNDLLGVMTVIAPRGIAEVKRDVVTHAMDVLERRRTTIQGDDAGRGSRSDKLDDEQARETPVLPR